MHELIKMGKHNFILSLLGFLLLWQIASESGLVNITLFPPPTEVAAATWEQVESGELIEHTTTSLYRVAIGLSIGSILGVVCGLTTGRVQFVHESLSPILHVFRSFPPVAIIPLIIVWLGIGESAKLFSISFAVFFPVWISTHSGASGIPVYYLRASSTLTSSKWKKWRHIVFPASIPFIITGIRTSIGIAYIMVFVSELAGASRGLGYLIYVSNLTYRIDIMMVGLLMLGLLGVLSDTLFVYVSGRIFPWIRKTNKS
ncbi:MAG: ABC transporter permease [Candidatus Altiarchaeota archaeon]